MGKRYATTHNSQLLVVNLPGEGALSDRFVLQLGACVEVGLALGKQGGDSETGEVVGCRTTTLGDAGCVIEKTPAHSNSKRRVL